jgi:hypothetical protein
MPFRTCRQCSERTSDVFFILWQKIITGSAACLLFKEAGYDLPQPFPLFGERLMPTPSHFLLDFLEARPHAVATAFSLQREAAAEIVRR